MKRIFTAIAIFPLALFAQPQGQTFVAGTTWYDLQHNGSCGRMIVVDADGNAYVTWTNGLDSLSHSRHVYYNVWYRLLQAFDDPSGFQADSSIRAGYATIAMVSDGCPVIAAHAIMNSVPVTVVIPCTPFQSFPRWPEEAFEQPPMWPQIAIGFDGSINLNGTGHSDPEISYAAHAHGIPLYDDTGVLTRVDWEAFAENTDWQFIEHAFFPTITIASARSAPRVATGWISCPEWDAGNCNFIDNDVKIIRSEDNGVSWLDTLNITQFVDGDQACLDQTHDTLRCNRDTLRPFVDLSLLFDQANALHAAFTTRSWFTFFEHWGPTTIPGASLIWHWNEATGQFSLIADGWLPAHEPYYNFGAYQLRVQRPSLSIDEATGNLYCAYMAYDTSTQSWDEYYSADVFISVSTNGGANWSVGTNVTRTHPASPPPVPYGASLSERAPTLAETISDGVLHLTYVLDHDAGSFLQSPPEGAVTSNEFIYQRIPIDSIPTTPLLDNYPLHWDSTGFWDAADNPQAPIPTELALRVYPNPFNSTTQLEFTLNRAAKIRITIHDILGRELTSLADKSFTAGTHKLNWNAVSYASGIYFVSLKTATTNQAQKLLLLK